METQTCEKKGISRKIGLATGALCVIVLISLGGAVINYTGRINSKDVMISNKNIEIEKKVPKSPICKQL